MRGGMPTDGSRHRKARLRSDGELVSADNGTFAVKFERDLLCRVVRELVGADSVVSEYAPLGFGTRMRTSQPLRAASARAWLLGAERPGVLRCRALSRARRDCVPRLAVKGRGRFGPRSREMRQSRAAGSVRWGAAFLDRFGPVHGGVLRSAEAVAGRLGRVGRGLAQDGVGGWYVSCRVLGLSSSAFLALGVGVRDAGVWGPGDRGVGSRRLSSGLREAPRRSSGRFRALESLDFPGARVDRRLERSLASSHLKQRVF